MPSRGIIYSASGERFIAEAIASARSSLRFNRVPHFVYGDRPPAEPAEGIYFVRFESCGNPYLDKIRNIAQMPFGQTIFLDTDTYVVDNIDELFDLLERFDLAAAQAPGYTGDDRGPSEAFYEFNTGVIPYRGTGAVGEFLANWAELYARWFRSPPSRLAPPASTSPFHRMAAYTNDQPAFRRALWESSLSFYALSPEYNYRTIFPGRLVGKAKIIHGRSTNYEKLAAHVNATVGPRLFQALGNVAGARPLTATSLNNLADLLRAEGDLAGARPLYERALAICEKVLGPEHPDTATSLNNLAVLLRAEGDLAGARPLYKRALAICEKALGPKHPNTATSLDNLADLLRAEGDLAGARPLYERALAMREKVLGPEHPATAVSLNNLAGLLQAEGDLAGARQLFKRALAIREKALGPEHPVTAASLNNLAGLLQAEGDLAGARPLFERAQAIHRKVPR
jgi:tetratricopeptide (TPR) repeat protein